MTARWRLARIEVFAVGPRRTTRHQNESTFYLLQGHHPHPEHGFVADVDIVLAYESQLAVIAHAQHREAGGYCLDRIAVPHIHRQVVLRDQQASARVDVKSARVYFLGLDMLDRGRLAGGLVDRVNHDAVFTAFEDLLSLKLYRGLGAIGPIQETAVGMYVDRACRLTRSNVVRLGQCLRAVCDFGLILSLSIRNMYILFCVSIDTYIQGLVG
jgi:hypothetical protein